jgi:nicotinate-nucleotide adenylyltransferase
MNVALFGGTFDPPHLGHRFIAAEAHRECHLDRLIFIPCHQSPHKASAPHASGEDRLEMLRLTVANFPWAEVSAWELERPGRSFSWETAEHFSQLYPEAKLHWILGADQWKSLDRWARPERLAELLTFIVFPRDGVTPAPHPRFRAHFLKASIQASSTEIRQALLAGETTHPNLLPTVADFIRSKQLYPFR